MTTTMMTKEAAPSHWYTPCVRETRWADWVSAHETKTWLEHTFCSKRKKNGSDQKHWRKSSSSFFSLHLAKRFEWNAINFLLLQCSFLMLPSRRSDSVSPQYAAVAVENKICNVVCFFFRLFFFFFRWIQFEKCTKMLQVYYCQKETIYEEMLQISLAPRTTKAYKAYTENGSD